MTPDKQPVNRPFLVILLGLLTLTVSLSIKHAGPVIEQATSFIQKIDPLDLPSKLPFRQPGYYPVSKVHDGDTIDVVIEGKTETVRLIGIDTPETKDPRKPVQCFGQAASAKTHQLLDDKSVRLETDPADSDRDKYHRLLRYVYLEDGTLINAELVKQGYAFAYTVFPFGKLEEFRSLEAEARAASRGLWSSCPVDETKQIKQTSPE